jgi:molybdopterin adenylyltransferase
MIPNHGQGSQQSVRFLIITCSDSRTYETDESGQLAESLIARAGHVVSQRLVVRDDPTEIVSALRAAEAGTDEAILISGGTGISRRDRTFDAVDKLLEKRIDGFGELFRMLSYEQVGAASMLSRATAGLYRGLVLFSVPGSVNAVRLALEKLILPVIGHAVKESRR